MLTWPEFWLPPLNLWSYPLYAQMNMKLEKKMLEKHKKFKEYWESIGHPPLECLVDGAWSSYPHELRPMPNFDTNGDYRIKGDKHWELRKSGLSRILLCGLNLDDGHMIVGYQYEAHQIG